jgi:hypothetical protein
MTLQDIKLIIVPDIHGRTFWEDVFKYDTEIVFLGDYLDPYPYEEIFPWDALDNFTHILTFAKKNPKVHLLLGNHDLAYAIGPHICRNRVDKANYDEIRRLFVDHQDLFAMAYDCTINGKTFFMSHAGITPGWYEMHSDIFDRSFTETLCADYINQLYSEGLLNRVLGNIGSDRKGTDGFGSVVWADIFEHLNNLREHKTDVIQIVGHSQLAGGPLLIKQNYLVYDVDIRQCVYLDTQGDLCSLKTGEKFVFD